MTEKNKICCKKCGNSLFQKVEDKIKIRTNIIVFEKSYDGFEKSQATIKCQICKEDNIVPIILDLDNQNDTQLKHFIFDKKEKK